MAFLTRICKHHTRVCRVRGDRCELSLKSERHKSVDVHWKHDGLCSQLSMECPAVESEHASECLDTASGIQYHRSRPLIHKCACAVSDKSCSMYAETVRYV